MATSRSAPSEAQAAESRLGHGRLGAVLALLLSNLVALPGLAAVLFELEADPSGIAFSDATGRHSLTIGSVAEGPPGIPAGGGTAVPTSVLTPGGSRSVLLTGAWLEILPGAGFEEDFLFGESQNLTVEFWFKSDGNGAYADEPTNPDRMHALGFGDLTNNLDVDLGDLDPAPLAETAVWTYFGSGGTNAVVDTHPLHDRNYYLDDAWHKYTLIRSGSSIEVYVDAEFIGATTYTGPLGSDSASARHYIGRSSLLTDAFVSGSAGTYAWFGYIGGVRVLDEAVAAPAPAVPTLSPTAWWLAAVLLGVLGFRRSQLAHVDRGSA